MAQETIIRPQIDPELALRIASGRFAIGATLAEPLQSDRDQNFVLTEEASGRKYVLKLSHAGEDPEVLDLQNRILEHLARAGFPQSKVLRADDGSEIVRVAGPDGAVFLTRLLTWQPGSVLHDVTPQPPDLLRSLGTFLGGMDRALEDFSHPVQDRELLWDLKGAGRVVRNHLEWVEDPAQKALLEEMAERFMEHLGPLVPSLRRGVIHGDANDHNILVSALDPGMDPDARRVVGVVDFGHAIRSYTAGELAIACAHVMLGKDDPFTAAASVLAGYQRAFPLKEEEISALFPLMGLRLCASVAIAARPEQRERDHEYLTVTQARAWALLERLERESLDFPHFLFRQVCDLEPVPHAGRLVAWLQAHGGESSPVVGTERGPLALDSTPVHVFDLSADTAEFDSTPAPDEAGAWTDLLFGKMKEAGVEVGVGRYDEVRSWYTSDIFQAPSDGPQQWRTVHLGIDLFLAPGSPVYAPFDAVVRCVANNAGNLDYGPTVILEHRVEMGGTLQGADTPMVFWTLYGHLSEETLGEVSLGQAIRKGERFVSIGDYPSNGNWAAHLHFQIITHLLDRDRDFPGVGLPTQRDLWKSLSPDPNLILGIPLQT